MNGWFAVYCKPRGEQLAATNLSNQGYSVYFPRAELRRRKGGRWVPFIEPLFPRYLFIKPRDEAQSLAPVRSTIGVTGLVRFGGQPAFIPDHLVEALRACEQPGKGVHCLDNPLRAGAQVTFLEGPFRGLQAVFDQDCGDGRVIVFLDVLGKLNRLKVSSDWLDAA